MSQPLVSVISVVLNEAEKFGSTLESIRKIKGPQIEYIIIDGGSDDSTLKQLQSNSSIIDFFVSEKDGGIYDAMNKGWNAANGKFVIFINSGDQLLKIPLSELENSDADVMAGFVLLENDEIHEPKLGIKLKVRNTLHHQGTFYRRTIPERYNTDFKVFADFDLNQRLVKLGYNVILLESKEPISSHQSGGISHQKENLTEFYSVIRKNEGSFFVLISYLNFKFQGLKKLKI